jgi:hypothetical protein
MTHPVSNCPNCGAKVTFQWSGSVQTVCEYCKSILVRTDVDLKKVGEVADLPPDVSPIQINTEGVYQSKSFVVTGRILYEYDQGGWNEWHLAMNDGASAWLSDAQEEYSVSSLSNDQKLPGESQLQVGQQFQWNGDSYSLSVITRARYRGFQGELPFEFWGKTDVVFADFRSTTRKFATLDYSGEEPALYLGEFVEFEDLKMKGLRQFEGWS